MFIGAMLGLISVIVGAYTAHNSTLNAQQLNSLMTAVRYNQIYSILIIVIALVMLSNARLAKLKTLKVSCIMFIIGSVIFSFSIYISTIANLPALRPIAPIGGTTIMLAWIILSITGIHYTSIINKDKK